MKRIFTSLIMITSLAAMSFPVVSSASVNAGYWYTDYNAQRVNYYKHRNLAGRNPASTYAYPVYYPRYYPAYYPQYYTPCYDTYTVGPYYESWNRSPNCSDRIEDWHNRAGLPNQFLSELYGTTYY